MREIAKAALGVLAPRLQDYIRIRRGYRGKFGQSPNIIFPKTFNEKIQRLKLGHRDPRFPERVDKVLVKEFVDATLGAGWTTPTLWHGTKLPPQSERIWPLPFVLKANHGSAMNLFVLEEPGRQWLTMELMCKKWMEHTYGEWGGEWVYWKVKPQLLIEPFIGTVGVLPKDFKLWTFHGRVQFIQVDTDRERQHRRTMYDRNWNRLPFTLIYPPTDTDVDRPASLDRMIEASERLSEGVPFVRVDFYEINEKPIFGEMTYFPESGFGRFSPHNYDEEIGRLL